jgi:hypothetical protein
VSSLEGEHVAEEHRVQQRGEVRVGLAKSLFTSALQTPNETELMSHDTDFFYLHCLHQAVCFVDPRQAIQKVERYVSSFPYPTGLVYAKINDEDDGVDSEEIEEMPMQPLGVNPMLLKHVVHGMTTDFSTAIAAEGQMLRCFLSCHTNLERFVFFELWMCVVLRFVAIERCSPLFDAHGMVSSYYSFVSVMAKERPDQAPYDRANVLAEFWESLVYDIIWFRNKELPLDKYVVTQYEPKGMSGLSGVEIFDKVYELRQNPEWPERCGFMSFYHLGKGGLLSAAMSYPKPASITISKKGRRGRMHCYVCYLGHTCSQMGGLERTLFVSPDAPRGAYHYSEAAVICASPEGLEGC